MTITLVLISTTACLAVAVFALSRKSDWIAYRFLVVGIVVLGVEQLLVLLTLQSVQHALLWAQIRSVVLAAAAGIWLAFAVTFGRANFRDYLKRWRWVFWVVSGSLVVVSSIAGRFFFQGPPVLRAADSQLLTLGWAGQLYHALLIVSITLIVMNMERTLRASVGRMRWQIKFMILGLASVFGARLYTSSQALLFSGMTSELESVNSVALLLGCALMLVSLRRTDIARFDLYLSPTALHRSLTVVATGCYLIGVGLVVKVVQYLGWNDEWPIQSMILLVALVVLAAALLSDRFQQDVRRTVSRHFRRPTYDYRRIWTHLNERTGSIVNSVELCREGVRLVSEIFESLSVSAWILESDQTLRLQASTGQTTEQGAPPIRELAVRKTFPQNLAVIDLERDDWEGAVHFRQTSPSGQVRYLIPLRARDELVGVLAVGERVRYRPLSLEDCELLEVIAEHLAGQLLNLRQAQHLQEAREMEAFQRMSTFLAHDLKNLASRLSLTVQNLPLHFENPEFRADALKTISESVNKMRRMCGRLNVLQEGLKIKTKKLCVNEIVSGTLADLKLTLGSGVSCRVEEPLPVVEADPEQLKKVLGNLLLNAQEASLGGEGNILIATASRNHSVEFSVTDRGSGMSPEFVATKLFQPFQTTKKHGMGIGLFHSKAIVEAHGGRIEVESQEGVGSTFRVVLPVKKESGGRRQEGGRQER